MPSDDASDGYVFGDDDNGGRGALNFVMVLTDCV